MADVEPRQDHDDLRSQQVQSRVVNPVFEQDVINSQIINAAGNVNVYGPPSDELRGIIDRAIAQALSQRGSLAQDISSAEDLIETIRSAIEATQQGVSPDQYYLLGMLYINRGELEAAEASLLASLNTNPQLGKAYLGLGMIWQMYANEVIRLKLFRPAEELLTKSEEYVKIAREYRDDDPAVYAQLGYTYKDLLQRYKQAGREQRARESYKKAAFQFNAALANDPENASAHNGLGSLCLIEGDYDGAIRESGEAVRLFPKYLAALHDLSWAHYSKARVASTEVERAESFREFLKTFTTLVELDGVDAEAGSLPPIARERLDSAAAWVMHQVNLMHDAGSGNTATESQLPPSEAEPGEAGGVQLHPAGSVLIVIVKDTPMRPLLNLDCRLVNRSDTPATVERLAVRLQDPSGSSFQLDWTLFYGGAPVMRKLSGAKPVELAPSESRVLGVQVAGSPGIGEYTWTEGVYDMELVGWVDGQEASNPPTVKTSCRLELSLAEVNYLRRWEMASEAQWAELADPDNAVGIPVDLRLWDASGL